MANDRNRFTYERTVSGHVVGEDDVRIVFEGHGFGWTVELYDLNTGEFFEAPRDEADRVMEWARKRRNEYLIELVRDHTAGRRADELIASKEPAE